MTSKNYWADIFCSPENIVQVLPTKTPGTFTINILSGRLNVLTSQTFKASSQNLHTGISEALAAGRNLKTSLN